MDMFDLSGKVAVVTGASKGAVAGLTIGLAASLSQYGITVNAICPGLFESEMTKGTLF